MKILGRLAFLFVVIPVLELVLLIELGRYIGPLPTIGIVVLTGMTGAGLQGRRDCVSSFVSKRSLSQVDCLARRCSMASVFSLAVLFCLRQVLLPMF
jgi:hypothetical protein